MSQDVIVSHDYAGLVPQLSTQEYESLKRSIKENGQYFPIILNSRNVILDGHHRFKICRELGIKPIISVKDFDDLDHEKLFVGECALLGRNLNAFQRTELALKLKPTLQAIAKRNESLGGKGVKDFTPLKRVSEEIGNHAQVSHVTVRKVEAILHEATPDLIDKARQGQRTINKAFTLTQKEQRRVVVNEDEIAKLKLPDNNNIQLVNDDFRQYRKFIPDNSINLIFTDPPYPESWLPNYADLAKLAANTLVPNGSLVTYCNHTQIPEIIGYMRNERLVYWWMFAVFLQGPFKPYWSREVDQQYKLLLWFVKGKRERTGHNIFDRIDSLRAKKDLFEWEQHTAEPEYVISQLTRPNQKVLDPMMGEGTTGIAALALTRKFVGIDKHPERFKDTRDRIAKFVSSGLDLKSELKPALNPIARGMK